MCKGTIHTRRPRTCAGRCSLCCGYTPCVIALMLIALNVAPYHLCFLRMLYTACVSGSAPFVFYYYCLIVMIFSEAMVYGNYFLAVFTSPGFVPHEPWSKAPVFEGKMISENPCEVMELDRGGKLRYCSYCSQFKPDQARHCDLCDRCVFRMDHHCPWINNCVGRGNSKYFLLFVSYIPFGAFHVVLTTLFSCIFYFPNFFQFEMRDDQVLNNVVILVSLVFSTAMGLCFLAFAMHFLWMAYRGETSVSRMISSKKHAAELEQLRRREKEDRALFLFDLFGADRRWYRAILPFRPIHDPGRAPPGYVRRFGDGLQEAPMDIV